MEVEEDFKQGDLYRELFKQLAHKATGSVRHEDIDMLSVYDWARFNEPTHRAEPLLQNSHNRPRTSLVLSASRALSIAFEKATCTPSVGS